jgi:formylglycine-generating enzyme required for sulfatase activity
MDMSGNVMEWVNDWFQLDYYSSSPYDNPTGPVDGTSKSLRGGSWFFDYSGIMVADRIHASLEYSASTIGFRCAADVP